MPAYIIILLQISLSLLLCWGVYGLFIRRIHQFAMQRLYLNFSLLLSLMIPLLVSRLNVIAPVPENWKFLIPAGMEETGQAIATTINTPDALAFSWWWLPASVYLAGAGFRLFILFLEIVRIRQLYITARKEKQQGFTLVFAGSILRPFSFFRLIFLGENMDTAARKYTIIHESAHVTGYHSWDNLVFELTRAVLWFHPCMHRYKRYLSEVHEYLADEEVIRQSESRRSYAHFLLEHTSQTDAQHLVLGLSNKLITKRILMLSRPSLRPVTYLYLLLLFPVGALCFTACSMMEDEPAVQEDVIEVPALDTEYAHFEGLLINSISWQGNTKYSDETLARAVDIRAGMPFKTSLTDKLAYSPTGEDISSLYMDNGYLFFSINPEVVPAGNGRVDLTFHIYEGDVVKVGTVCVTTEEGLSNSLMDYVDVRPGELFSRAALISTSKKLTDASNGMLVNAIPKPYPEQGLVDLEFAISKPQAN